MSTRAETQAETPTETRAENSTTDPYAPRWVRDPSYQVLRRAETLKRTAITHETTETPPCVPCQEPDLPPSIPGFLGGKRQGGEGELYIDNIRVPHSLRPRRSPEVEEEEEEWPRRRRKKRRLGRRTLQVGVAVAASTVIAYFVAEQPSVDRIAGMFAPAVDTSVASATITPAVPPIGKPLKTIRITRSGEEQWPVDNAAKDTAPAPTYQLAAWHSEPASATPGATPPAMSPEAPSETPPWPSVTEPSQPRAAKAAREPLAPHATTLDAETIALLIKRGRQFISAGDLASARILLRRAAEAGDRGAALAMAGTFDPAALKRLGVRGLAPDPEQARFWYEKARQLGAPEAPQLLDRLAARTD